MIKLATNLQNLLIKQSKDGTCWKGYKQVGKKMKDGKLVPDCVPADKQAENYHTNPELWARAKAKARSKTASKKTKKKANTLASESIVDVPIRCTPGFGCKRYLTPQEAAEVALAKQQIMPDYLATEADPVSSQMSSPSWSAAGHGVLGALLGAGVGAGGGKLLGSNVPISALLGGALGGIGGGLYGYGSKVRENKEIEDLIEDLPVGADIGDIEVFSDPKLKQQLARDFQRQLVRRGLMNENERSY